jgi:hypothetical protein
MQQEEAMAAPQNVALLIAVTGLALPTPAAAELPSAAEALELLGLAADREQIMAGKIVSQPAKPSNPRELAIAMAFVVRESPANLVQHAREELLGDTGPKNLSKGEFDGEGSLADLAGLELRPNPAERAKQYLGASPGEDFNLSSREIAAFRSLGSSAGVQAVIEQIKRNLLARYQAYRAKGLDGIEPYARSKSQSWSPAGDLRAAIQASKVLEQYMSDFRQVLLRWPQDKPEQLEESFRWSNFATPSAPSLILTHELYMPEGDGFVVGQRQFYVSRGYNTEQAIAAFIPVSEGTLVAYTNRTSTDKVEGFGGSTKRSIGSKLMARQLSSLYERVQKDAEK